jgi:hypothetical protein
MTAISEYPLCWPRGWPRTKPLDRKAGRFKNGKTDVTYYAAEKRVQDEIRALCECPAEQIIVSSNMLRTREPDDPGIAVYFQMGAKPMVIAIDVYSAVAQNLAAIAATVDAMRAIERPGGARILERAFTGFTALGPPKGWREVLGFRKDANPKSDDVEHAFRQLARKHHPDTGGDAGQFAEISSAIAQAREELKNG